MSIADIRKGLATNLATVRGLRVAETIPDNPSPPIAVLSLANVVYDGAYAGGLVEYNFIVTVIVGRVSEREAQRRLDSYIAPDGIKAAIESERSLDGAIYDLRVTEMTNIGSLIINDITYLACDFSVVVYGN